MPKPGIKARFAIARPKSSDATMEAGSRNFLQIVNNKHQRKNLASYSIAGFLCAIKVADGVRTHDNRNHKS